MTPIQLWLPLIQGGVRDGPRERDRQRAFEAWDRDHVIWLVPGWDGPDCWQQHGMRVRCLSSEELECIRVLHIGDNWQVVGPSVAAFPNQSIGGLLDAWVKEQCLQLTIQGIGESAEREISVSVPHTVEGGITHLPETLVVRSIGRIPVRQIDDEERTVFFSWPASDGAPRPVSPAQESRMAEIEDMHHSAWVRIAWPEPFEKLMPVVDSSDDLFARDQMRMVAEVNTHDHMRAMKQAMEQSRVWTSDGFSDVNNAWLKPIIAQEGEEGALFALEARFAISALTLAEVYQHEDVRRRLKDPVKIRRAWGVPGLMWALLLDRLEAGSGFRFCERCGRLLPQTSRARFCRRRDNPECRRKYERERKQRQRMR